MTSWADLEKRAPDLADAARSVFEATTNAVLATLRKDGSPRISGIDPTFRDGDLWLGGMPGGRKSADLRRDPRLAMHCIPFESRALADIEVSGDAKLTGRAVEVTDPDERRRYTDPLEDAGEYVPDGPFDLFVVDLKEVVTISVEGDRLIIDSWSATRGRRRWARGNGPDEVELLD